MKKKLIWASLLIAVSLLAGCSSSVKNESIYGLTGNPADFAGINSPSVDGGSSVDDNPLAVEENPDVKVVWTGSVSMETTEWDDTLSDVQDAMSEYGVQIMGSSVSGGDRYYAQGSSLRTEYTAQSISYVLRVPSESFNDFMNSIGDVTGSVTSSNISREDMTKEYDENAISLDVWQSEYDALSELLKRATNVDDILSIRDRMTEAATKIKIFSDANSEIDYDVEWSKVSLKISEVASYTDRDAEGNIFVRISKAFKDGAKNFGAFLGNSAVWISGHLFYLILAVGILLAAAYGTKKFRRRKKVSIVSDDEGNDEDE